jgi:hypothetical protein
MAERSKSLKDDLEELRAMRRRSEERQGKDTKSEMGSKAMGIKGSAANFQGGGYTTKTKVDGSSMRDKPLSKANLQDYKDAQKDGQKKADAQVKYKKPPRRATGREAMIAERYMNQEQKKKDRQSSVVGDD